jgi:hypothetical protein
MHPNTATNTNAKTFWIMPASCKPQALPVDRLAIYEKTSA